MIRRTFMKTLSRFLVILLVALLPSLPLHAQSPETQPCPFPEDYLDNLLNDLTTTGENIGEVDTTDPAALSLAYVEMYQLRHRYENMIPNLPDCALRGHLYFTNILGNWEDILGLALATHANPDATEQYVSEIAVIQDRIEFFTPLLLEVFFPPLPPTPTPAPPTEIPVLSLFYVATQGLNVRAGPGAEFESIGILTGGTQVSVIGLDTKANGEVWYHILYESEIVDNDGTGWVFGPLISPERPEAFPEPLPTERLPTSTPRP